MPVGPSSDEDRAQLPAGDWWDGTTRWRRIGNVGIVRVMALLEAGAPVAVDPCGCGGYCGFDRPEQLLADRLRLIGRNRWQRLLRRKAAEEWQDQHGNPLLLLVDVDLAEL
jgi:hypothetical protein